MSQELTFNASVRDIKENLKDLRDSGFILAVLYGPKIKNVSLKLKKQEFINFFSKVGQSQVFDLTIDGKDSSSVIVKNVQKTRMHNEIDHVDFYQIDKSRKIVVEIPLSFVGESEVIKKMGGTMLINRETVSVKCFPTDLAKNIEVDLSQLKSFSDSIRVKDLKISDKVEILGHPGELIVNIIAPKRKEVVAPTEKAPAKKGK
jgi:large subunit ribosomal protein L25